MTLFDMYSLMELILNKDYGGNILTPERFRQLIKVVNIEKFKKKYGLPEEYQPGRPVPREYVEITLKNADDLRKFKATPLINTPAVDGLLPYPEDYAHRDQIIYNQTVFTGVAPEIIPRQVEILPETQAAARRSNYTKAPTATYPIGVMRSAGIQIYPITIDVVDFFYWRFPVEPVFSYNQYAGYITYNAAASVEFEWPPDEHISLVAMMLGYLGINMREADVVNYSEMKKQTGV
jgi:hypothetical protein